MNTIKKIAIALAVLMVFSLAAPAAADYSGDYPLVTSDTDMINGGIVYETVEDGSAYTKLFCTVYRSDQGFGQSSENWRNLEQTIEITGIPAGATVKMARLYNYVSWSTSDRDIGKYFPDYNIGPNPGMPAEADIWFSGVKKVCKHGLADSLSARDSLANPIDYNNGVIQYWDTKGQSYSSKKWEYPSGTFAWDVTDLVTGNGVYTAKITNNDTTPTGVRPGEPITSVKRERFVTYGFGLLVVYEYPCSPTIQYWIDEGCDLLLNTSKYGVYEPIATTSAPFAGNVIACGADAELTAVVVTCDKGDAEDWTASLNMNYFNSLTEDEEIGPSTAANYKAIGLNYYDVLSLMQPNNNVAYFQDRDLGTGRGDNEVVSNAFLVVTCPSIPPISADVTFDKKKVKLNSNGILKAFITLPEPYDVAYIDISTVTCEGAKAIDCNIIPGKQALEAKFKIQELQGLEPGLEVELTVTGCVAGTPFEGSDTVSVRG